MSQFELPEFDPHDLAPWITIMARWHAPVRAAARLTGESLAMVRQVYDSVGGASRGDAVPEKTPPQWFTDTTNRRYHGAVIASFFGQVRNIYPGAIGCAVVHSYSYYLRLATGGPDDGAAGQLLDLDGHDTSALISFARSVDLLDHVFGIDARHAPTPSLTVAKCRSCGSLYIDVPDPSLAIASCVLCERGPVVELLATGRKT